METYKPERQRGRNLNQIVMEGVHDQSKTFSDIRNELREAGHDRPGGELLSIARDEGRISQEMDAAIMETIRLVAGRLAARIATDRRSGVAVEPTFLAQIRKYAENEPDISEILQSYAAIAPKAAPLNRYRAAGLELDDEQQKEVDEFSRLRKLISSDWERAPARLLLHYYDNGDLKFIWDLTEDDTDRSLGLRSGGHRRGTISGASHNW